MTMNGITFRKILILLLLAVCVLNSRVLSQRYYTFNNIDGVTKKLCVRGLVQSPDGIIWLATESGLYSYNGYHLVKRPVKESVNSRMDIGCFNCLLSVGDSLLIGCDKGVLSFNIKTSSFRLLSYAKDEMVKDVCRTATGILVATKNAIYRDGVKLEPCPDNIVSMYSDETYMYIGTYNAVYRYTLMDQQLEKLTEDISYATCFLPDKQNDLLWIGTASNITLWSNSERKKLFSIPLPVAKSLCADNWGNTLVGTDNGLYIVDKDRQVRTVIHDARRENSLAGDAVWCIFKDQNKNIWTGTNSGVSLVPGDGLMSTYSLPAITGKGAGNQLFCVYSDSKDRKWLGGSNGLIYIKRLGKDNQSYNWYQMNDAHYPLPHNRVRDILEDRNGQIYIGGDMGLMLYNEDSKQFQRYRINEDPYNWVYGIRETGNNELAITTFTATYTVTIDKALHSVIVKKTTQRESLSTKTVKEKALLDKYGLSDNYLSAFYDVGSGVLLLGGTDSFSELYTKKLDKTRTKLKLSITDIRINDSLYVNQEEIRQDIVKLQPEDKMVEVLFSDFNYSGELLRNYLYRIDDGEWIPVHSRFNSIILTNLKPGTFKLSIRSSESTTTDLVLDFTVIAPWYATTLAKVVYLLLFIVLVYGIYYTIQQRRRIGKEHEEYQAMLLGVKQKEKELLSENEFLATQLRLQLLAKAGEDGVLSQDEKFLLKITKLIENNLSDSELNVNKLSGLSGINSKQLYRKIKAMTGMTTVSYIRDQRLKKAASLLAKGTFTVSEVMYMVGFSNPSYFTRCFTEEYKTAPSEYRYDKPKELQQQTH